MILDESKSPRGRFIIVFMSMVQRDISGKNISILNYHFRPFGLINIITDLWNYLDF